MKNTFLLGVILFSGVFGTSHASSIHCRDLGPIKETFLQMRKLDNSHLRVMSYNIRVDHEADQNTENQWKFRIDKVASIINNYDPDVIGLQEPNKSQIEDLQKRFMDTHEIVYAVVNEKAHEDREFYKSEQHREAHAIMYRKDRIKLIGKIGHFWLAENPNQFPETPQWGGSPFARMAVYAALKDKITDKVFRIFNAHFDHVYNPNSNTDARVESAKLMAETALDVSQGIPVMLMGDFNTFVEDGGPEILSAFKAYEKDGIYDVRDIALEVHGINNTWVGWSNNSYNEEAVKQQYPDKQNQIRYDQFYVRDMNVLQTGVADDQWDVEFNGKTKRVYPSDHRPIIVDVVIN